MVLPLYGADMDVGGPDGHSYAAVILLLGDGPCTRADVLAALRKVRFSGWLGPTEDGRLIAVAFRGGGTVAAGRRGVAGVGAWLADRLPATVLAVRVLRDRQLLLAAWADGEEVGRYLSDPSREPGAGDDVLPDPLGTEHAPGFAAACGLPDVAGDLAEILAEHLDQDSVFESERLARVLRLLRLPTWLVAAAALPRDIPTGPRTRDMTRLGAGVPGLLGRIWGGAAEVVRRRRPPPPAVTDVPRGRSGADPWLF
jgi:hypothetical protein